MKLGSLKRAGFAIEVSPLPEEEVPAGYPYVQAFAIGVAMIACFSATIMTYKAGVVYLGIQNDPYGRDLVVGAWIGVPTAIAGAISAYLGWQGCRGEIIRYTAALMIFLNLLVPLSWAIMALIK